MVPRKSVQAVPVEPLLGPLIGLSGTQVAAPLLDHQAEQPPSHVPVDLAELRGGVAGAKVVAPATQDRSQRRDHVTDIDTRPGYDRCGQRTLARNLTMAAWLGQRCR